MQVAQGEPGGSCGAFSSARAQARLQTTPLRPFLHGGEVVQTDTGTTLRVSLGSRLLTVNPKKSSIDGNNLVTTCVAMT
jgi:hypothetical protein